MFPTSILNPEDLAILLMFSTPVIAILAWYHVKLTELRAKLKGSEGLVSQIARLKEELEQLRETTTRYDLSFDTALQRLESRIESLERQNTSRNAAAQVGERG